MRSFIGFGQKPYIGVPYAQAIKLGNLDGKAIPLLFQWISYGASSNTPNINVLVSIDNPTCKGFDQIRSIYIDNLGSPNPVYVNCPDTNYTVTAKPNSEGWYPVFTNSRTLQVIGEGFTTGNIPQTFILVSNVNQIPAVNSEFDQTIQLWRASPLITRGNSIYNTTLGIPALGDQFFASAQLNVAPLGGSANLWNTPYSSGFLYIKSLMIKYSTTPLVAGGATLVFDILSTGTAGVLVQLQNTAFQNTNTPPENLFDDSNIQLDATQTWQLQIISTVNMSGTLQAVSTFTQQP